MKRFAPLLVAVPLVFASACGGSNGSVGKASQQSPAETEQSALAQFVLIDVRDPDEFFAGHLAGATNVPYNDGTLESQLSTMDKTARYGVYCHSGRRSGLSVAMMQAAGFSDVTDLGGIDAAVSSTGLAIVTS